MSRWVLALGVVTVLALTAAAPAADPDPIKAKLDKARTAHEEELNALEKSATDALDKAEAAARKAGDKKALDKVKADRELFELTGAIPKSVPVGVTQKVTAARKALETAYATAVKEYTKASKDAEAAAADKELAALKDLGTARPRFFLIVNKNSQLVLGPTKESAEQGGRLVQVDNTGADSQLWSLVPGGAPDVYRLRNKASGLFAGVGNSRNAAQDLALEKDANDGTRWVLEREGFHFLFQNVHSKLYAAVGEARKETGARVLQWHKIEKSDEQRWNLVGAKPK